MIQERNAFLQNVWKKENEQRVNVTRVTSSSYGISAERIFRRVWNRDKQSPFACGHRGGEAERGRHVQCRTQHVVQNLVFFCTVVKRSRGKCHLRNVSWNIRWEGFFVSLSRCILSRNTCTQPLCTKSSKLTKRLMQLFFWWLDVLHACTESNGKVDISLRKEWCYI